MTRHHWVPQSLLAHFTKSGTKRDRLWSYSKTSETFEAVRAQDVCYADDLYGLDEQSIQRALEQGHVLGPDGMEQMLARDVDKRALRVIRTLNYHSQPVDRDDLSFVVSYMATQVVRTPYYLGRLAEEAGGDVRYSDLLLSALDDQPKVFEGLHERRWTLWKPKRRTGYFFISDNPVVLSTESGAPLDLLPANFTKADSVVSMPLGKRLMISGAFDGEHAFTYEPGTDFVAFLNSLSLAGCCLHLYGPTPHLTKLQDGWPVSVWHRTVAERQEATAPPG